MSWKDNLSEVSYWIVLTLATALILVVAYSCAHASNSSLKLGTCWSEPHHVTDKYTHRKIAGESKLCWHPSTTHTKITHPRASYGHGEPSYKQSSNAAITVLTKPVLRPATMKAINDFLLMRGLSHDQMLKDYLIHKMIEIQQRSIEP